MLTTGAQTHGESSNKSYCMCLKLLPCYSRQSDIDEKGARHLSKTDPLGRGGFTVTPGRGGAPGGSLFTKRMHCASQMMRHSYGALAGGGNVVTIKREGSSLGKSGEKIG